jgi:hypothetical protein
MPNAVHKRSFTKAPEPPAKPGLGVADLAIAAQ